MSVAHIELIDDKTAALRFLATDKKHKNKGYATYILTFLEKWLNLQKIEVIKTHASLEAKEFYTRLGYKQMTFNDKSISKNIIDLGKII